LKIPGFFIQRLYHCRAEWNYHLKSPVWSVSITKSSLEVSKVGFMLTLYQMAHLKCFLALFQRIKVARWVNCMLKRISHRQSSVVVFMNEKLSPGMYLCHSWKILNLRYSKRSYISSQALRTNTFSYLHWRKSTLWIQWR